MAKATTKTAGTSARAYAARGGTGAGTSVREAPTDERDEVIDMPRVSSNRNTDEDVEVLDSATEDEALAETDAETANETADVATDARDVVPAHASARSVRTTGLRRVEAPTWLANVPVLGGIIVFVLDSIFELRKVTWPTWRQAWNMTLIVIAMSVAVAIVLGLADLGLARALGWLISLGGK